MSHDCDLEINLLSCLIQKPKLMENLALDEKYFTKHKRLYKFMKSFYKQFQTFDLVLMYQICKDKYSIIKYIEWLAEVPAMVHHFDKYKEQLIKMYDQKQKDSWIIDKIYSLSTDLYIGNVELKDFEKKYNQIKQEAIELFRKGD